jgi:hypothetical protein
VAEDPAVTRFGSGESLRLTASAAAQGHRIERAFPDEDLSDLEELRLWIRSTRPGDGAAGRPLYLEVALASAALGFADPANTWRRWLPVVQADRWELVRLSLDDLPGPIRAAASAIRITVLDESLGFTAHFDALFASREEMIADVETALEESLDGAFTVGGQSVGVVFYHATGTNPPKPPAAAQRPAIRVRLQAASPASARARAAAAPRDFSGDGFRMNGYAETYALDYALEPFSDQRRHDAAILGALLRTFAPRATLIAGGLPLPVEWQGIDAEPLVGERAVGRLRVLTTLAVRPAVPVQPVRALELTIDAPAAS